MGIPESADKPGSLLRVDRPEELVEGKRVLEFVAIGVKLAHISVRFEVYELVASPIQQPAFRPLMRKHVGDGFVGRIDVAAVAGEPGETGERAKQVLLVCHI